MAPPFDWPVVRDLGPRLFRSFAAEAPRPSDKLLRAALGAHR